MKMNYPKKFKLVEKKKIQVEYPMAYKAQAV